MAYDIFLQNNSSKQEWVVTGLENSSDNNLYLRFDDFSMPVDAPEGEYTYALIYNGRDDVVYDLKDVLLESVLHTEEGDVTLRNLRPMIGLLKYGTVVSDNTTYRKDVNKDFYYRKK